MSRSKCIGWMLCILVLMGVFSGCRADRAEPTGTRPTDAVLQLPETVPAQVTEPPAEPTQPKPIVETARATITVTGDVMMHIPLINSGFDGSSYHYDSIFEHIAPYVSAADLAVANLETTLAGTENGDPYSGFPRFNCPDALADALKNAGFDLLLTANNHSNDTGAYGMNRTLEVIADRGMLSLGTTRNAGDPSCLVQDLNGIRVGMVCYTYGQIDGATGQKSVNGLPVRQSMTEQINVFDYEKLDRFYDEMEEHIAAMKADGADAIVLFIHWGNEYKTQHAGAQAAIAQAMCDLGVDVIVGGHPHVVQDVELLTGSGDPAHRTLCVYSLGNALSNQRSTNMDLDTGHTEDGMLFSFTFVRYCDGSVFLEEAQFLPTWVCVDYSGPSRSYQILPLDGGIADWQSTFTIGSADLGSAQASYDRTCALVESGMAAVQAYLEECEADRGAAYISLKNSVG